jgi:hypothetical protein
MSSFRHHLSFYALVNFKRARIVSLTWTGKKGNNKKDLKIFTAFSLSTTFTNQRHCTAMLNSAKTKKELSTFASVDFMCQAFLLNCSRLFGGKGGIRKSASDLQKSYSSIRSLRFNVESRWDGTRKETVLF